VLLTMNLTAVTAEERRHPVRRTMSKCPHEREAICGYSLDGSRVSRSLSSGAHSRDPLAHPGYAGYSVSNCANRGFAGATVSGHFAQTDPGLGGRLRAGPCAPCSCRIPCPMILLGPDLCSCILHGPGPSGLFSWARPGGGSCTAVREPACTGCAGRPVPVSHPPLPRPGMLEQGLGERLADLGLARESGRGQFSSSVRSTRTSRFDSRSSLVACRRVRCRVVGKSGVPAIETEWLFDDRTGSDGRISGAPVRYGLHKIPSTLATAQPGFSIERTCAGDPLSLR
jgi:hypothetical protein